MKDRVTIVTSSHGKVVSVFEDEREAQRFITSYDQMQLRVYGTGWKSGEYVASLTYQTHNVIRADV